MQSKNYMLLVVGLLLIFITSASAAPLKLPASSKTPAAQQSMTPTTVQPVGGTLTITSISGMPNLKVGDNATILWNASQISSSTTLKLTLLRNSATIGDIANSLYAPFGKYVWEVGKGTGPAITTFGPGYSIRLCTMDNSKCTVSGQFSISAASSQPSDTSHAVIKTLAREAVTRPILPRKIVVISPGSPSWPSTGIKLHIRWTSTCGTNPEGPAIDFFTIELLAGNKVDKLLLDGGAASYDGEAPEGVHNWHWIWEIPVDQTPQTYTIRVTNIYGNCAGMSKSFTVVNNPALNPFIPTNTIKDPVTGQFWLKNANCFGTNTWDQAMVAAQSMKPGSCGLDESSAKCKWRLPTKEELQKRSGNKQGFYNVQSGKNYWSGTTGIDNKVWFVYINDGNSNVGNKNSSLYIWPICDVQ